MRLVRELDWRSVTRHKVIDGVNDGVYGLCNCKIVGDEGFGGRDFASRRLGVAILFGFLTLQGQYSLEHGMSDVSTYFICPRIGLSLLIPYP